MKEAVDFAGALHLAVKSLQFYSPEHPRAAEALSVLGQAATAMLGARGRMLLTATKGALLIDGEPLVSSTAHVKNLATDLERREIGGIVLMQGVTTRELLELARTMALRPEQIKAGGGMGEILRRADVSHVRISNVRYEAVTEDEEVVLAKNIRRDAPPPENAADALPALWDKLPFDQRLEKLLTGDRVFEIPVDKLQRFLRELLQTERHADLHRLLERYVAGLDHESILIRQSVCQTLGQVMMNIKDRGLPRDIEQLTGTAILNQFAREKDARMRGVLGDSAATFIAMLIGTGRSEPALRVLLRLDEVVAAAPEGAAVRLASESLTHAIGEPHRAQELVEQVCAADAESLAKWVLPLVTRFGATIAPHLIEALGREEDRNRRGRLVKALKTIGEPAFPFLVDALSAPVWFVVRNALNVLGDVGTQAEVDAIGRKLEHGDARVRRAAARALGKIGGFDAEAQLVGALGDRDSETQAEVLLCLGAMKAQTAVAGVAELAKSRLRTEEKVRELAVTTLGQIASEDAVPVLTDILRPKTFFGRESPPVRIAAAKALASIGTPAAKDTLRSAHAAETDRATKAFLAKLL